MSDTTAEPITLEAFDPAELLMDANARSDAEATVDKAFVASLKAHAATSPKFPVYGDPTRLAGCGNYVPITIVRRPDGQLRVRAGHRRNIGCMRAGVRVLGFIAGDEGDEQADRRARLIEQWNENHHREAMTVRDDTAVLLALFDEEEMTEAAHRQGHRPAPAAGRRIPDRGPVPDRREGRRPVGVPDPGPGRDPGRVRGRPRGADRASPGGEGQPRPVRPPRRPAPRHPRRAGSQGRVHRRARSAGDRDLRRPAPRAVDPGPGEPARRRRERDHPRGARHLPRPGRDHHLRLGLGSRRGGRVPGRARPGRR